MQLPRMQLTIRRMMIAVAVVAVAFSIPVGLRSRSEALARVSQAHFRAANAVLSAPRGPAGASLFHRHVQLGYRYRSAATRPWLPVEGDPPLPPE